MDLMYELVEEEMWDLNDDNFDRMMALENEDLDAEKELQELELLMEEEF